LIACLLAAKKQQTADWNGAPGQIKIKSDNGATLFNLQQPAMISKI